MGNIIRETECISSRYSNEFEVEMERREKEEKRKLRRHDDALDQEQKKKKRRNKELIKCGSKKTMQQIDRW